MKNVTVRQYIARRTSSYRARYRRLLITTDNPWDRRYMEPEREIPRADHAFQFGPFLVSRPYHMEGDTLRDIVEWTAKHDLDFDIDAPSSWHPSTLLVTVYRRAWVQDFLDGARAHGDAFLSTLLDIQRRELYSTNTRVYTKPNNRETGVFILTGNAAKRGVTRQHYSSDIKHFLEAKQGYTLGLEE
jgi:hypothetical protein